LIDNGEFAAGARLPPERELAVLLGVSRTSVREALISLEIAGRVEVRVGTGIFVQRQPGNRVVVSSPGRGRRHGS
jgi:GntR family transcriptional repressor for pyruvate dehydrogenase complex